MSKKMKNTYSGRVKRIVCLGGGSLVPKVVLEPLKSYPIQITSITSMTESGGSTGQLRRDFNVLPSGDISRHLVGLSSAPSWRRELFSLRFGREKFPGGHVGHRFGTVFISLAEHTLGDFEKALRLAGDFLELKKHKVLPAVIDKVQLMAELENGKVIEGEDEVDVPKRHNPRLRIKRVFLKPRARVYPEAARAVAEADMVVFGPGDLYSSTIPCLLSEGMREALKKAKAKKVLVCNTITKLGETNNFSVLDFAKEIEKYINCSLDYVIYHKGTINRERFSEYKKEVPLALGLVRVNEGLSGPKFIGEDILVKQGFPSYDSKKIAKIIFKLCKR